MAISRIAVVTGANRGIGLEICRQLAKLGLKVVLTARDASKGEAARAALTKAGMDVIFYPLDVADDTSIESFSRYAEQELGRWDVLINNAGVYLDGSQSSVEVSGETFRRTVAINLTGPLLLSQAAIQLMRKNRYGRIVNVSTDMAAHDGALSSGGYPSYRISKAGLNAMTRVMAADLRGTNILVNAMSPGWVRTDMGGAGAPRSVEQGADTAVWLATLADGGPTGGYFRDRKPIRW
ncbi:MAG TPA: SDR family oxidoreductase [Candidatus Binataceae bacterium]|nr:SDR family oxidoreductase [Candidatus Binataceae bacterium]